MFASNISALNLKEHNFTIAFGINDFLTHETKNDSKLVRWEVEIAQSDGYEFWGDSQKVGVHLCTQADRDKFYPAANNTKIKIDKEFAKGGMYCLDELNWKGEPLELWGKDDVSDHRRLDLNFLPCEYKQITDANRHL